ncbi:hypothetical protein HPP92_006251 [Vanilla planifolia]|uniref:BAT2 N-terminal domain-containing protein n=1 Tax=Vanilla planifolia TaxID=51239 RepID=A0A835RLQ8_VANPL|nr:hypothetical protein HPP92_006251 [Vanilla planifolia]
MASSERRWASARRSGMTVLGKVPKPINLPSQKLENHGLDPNVDLVPKGTHTWGSRPSNASNAWVTSSVSPPQFDGSLGSPNNSYGRPSSHGNAYGRPSSGGSSTRPSTAGSDKSNESVAVALGSNSRPSSASGILPSSQIPVSLNRPRSAETRPGSSQLSRFSENSSDYNAWLSEGTPERLGVVASKRSDFSLNSGDFPSLGSEKISEMKSPARGNGNPDQKGHVNSSCKEDTEGPTGEVVPTNTENFWRDHPNVQPQVNSNIPPQQYGSWYVHAVHPPDRFSCGGNEAGGFYRPVGPSVNYPVDLYYPCAPARAMPTHDLGRPDTILGHHPGIGEPSRYLPDAYVAHSQSISSATTGVHPGPALYEGRYGPPPSYDSSDKQNALIGVSNQERLHNSYIYQNPGLDLGKFHALADRNSSTIIEGQVLADHVDGNDEKSKVLLKQHDDQVDKGTLVEQLIVAQSTPQRGKHGSSMMEKSLSGDIHKKEQISNKQFGEFSSLQVVGNLEDPSFMNISELSKQADQCVMHRPDDAPVPVNDIQRNPIGENTARLMEKVESLNGKTRIANVQIGGGNLPSKEIRITRNSSHGSELVKKVDLRSSASCIGHSVSSNNNLNTSHMKTSVEFNVPMSTHESNSVIGQSEQVFTTGNLSSSEAGEHSRSHHRNRFHNLKERVDDYARIKSGGFYADERNRFHDGPMEKTSVAVDDNGLSLLHSIGSEEAYEGKGSNLKVEVGNEECAPSSLGSVDIEVQRSKRKELARQRALQLQREEEERTREQKAKGLAKLEELNMRTSAASLKQNSAPAKPSSIADLDEKDVKSDIVEAFCKTMDFYLETSSKSDETMASIGGLQKISEERNESNTTLDDSVRLLQNASGGVSSIISEDPPTQLKKKNNRGLKFKYKNDFHQSPSSHLSTHLGKDNAEHCLEDDVAKPSGTVAEASPVSEKSYQKTMEHQVSNDSRTTPFTETESKPTREASQRVSSEWKAHLAKKQARSLHPNKANPKYQGSETVVWTPVNVSNKNGPSEELKNNSSESSDPSSEKGNVDMHIGAKAKRAELERYIPKPITKELLRDSQSPSPAVLPLIDASQKLESASSTIATVSDYNSFVTTAAFISSNKNAESSKQNRRGKPQPQASWRQRNAGESPPSKTNAAVDNSFPEPQNDVEMASSEHHSSRHNDDGKDGKYAVVRDLELNRQRHQQYKPSVVDRRRYAPTHNKELQYEIADRYETLSLQSPDDSTEKYTSKIANPSFVSEHVKSHWLPKSQEPNREVKEQSRGRSRFPQKGFAYSAESGHQAAYVEKPISHYGGSTRKDGKHFEHQKSVPCDKPSESTQFDMTDVQMDPHGPPSEPRHVHQGRNHNRHNGQFYGPRRAPVRTRGE